MYNRRLNYIKIFNVLIYLRTASALSMYTRWTQIAVFYVYIFISPIVVSILQVKQVERLYNSNLLHVAKYAQLQHSPAVKCRALALLGGLCISNFLLSADISLTALNGHSVSNPHKNFGPKQCTVHSKFVFAIRMHDTRKICDVEC